MIEALVPILPNLAVGVAAVLIFAVLLYYVFRIFVEALNERDEAFQKFVTENNHKSVEVLTQCRDAIQEAAENIRQNTEIQKQVVEHLIREGK